MDMKIEMKLDVICDRGYGQELTHGRIYGVMNEIRGHLTPTLSVFIFNDLGFKAWYDRSWFQTVPEGRRTKLERILKQKTTD